MQNDYLKILLIRLIIPLIVLLFFVKCFAITVLEIDTGVDKSHERIARHIKNTNIEIDANGHGTHIAGLILANTCKEVELVSCKWYEVLNGDFNKYLNCLKEAIKLKPDIINISSGGTNYNKEEFKLLTKLSDLNVIIVVAAGNNGKNLLMSGNDYYPAKYDIKNIIPVGNLDIDGQINITSNYGLTKEVYEMGTQILSTLPKENYGIMSGTSMSAAIRTNRILLQKCKELEEKRN